jgi:hypothetical protein
VTLAEAIEAVRAAGAVLLLDHDGAPKLRGRVAPEVIEALRADKPRVAAVLKLRAVHVAMGLSPADVAMVEAALLSGAVSEVRIAALPPAGPQ